MAATEAAASPSSLATAVLEHRSSGPYRFSFSPFLLAAHQVGLPADRAVCRAYAAGHCANGTACLERHAADAKSHAPAGGLNSLVCKHWLRGLCKKGEHCEFLHEYNLRKMPECNFFSRNGYCSNGDECLYLHLDPHSRLPPCPQYGQGFCPLGPRCAKKHVRRTMCRFYLAGFCPDGPGCTLGLHPMWDKNTEKSTVKLPDKVEEESLLLRRDPSDWEDERDRRDRDDGRAKYGRPKWKGARGGERKFRSRGNY